MKVGQFLVLFFLSRIFIDRRIFVILKSPGQFVELRARADERGTTVFIDETHYIWAIGWWQFGHGHPPECRVDGVPRRVPERPDAWHLFSFFFFFSFGPFPPTAMMKDYATCSIKYPRQSHHKCVVEIFLLCFVSRASARIFKGITPAHSCFRWCIFPRWWNEKIESWKPNQDTILYRVPSFFFPRFYYTIARRRV